MGIIAFNNPTVLNGPASPDVTTRWRIRSSSVDDSQGVEILMPSVPAGSTKHPVAPILTGVNQNAQGNTITAQALVYSATMGMTFTATLDTYILLIVPTATPAVASPTPVAGEGKIVCYPQPAKDTMCFAYHAALGGKLEITLYNSAFELVGRVHDTAVGGTMETSCVDISGMAPGVYFYKAKVGDFAFPMQQFGIAR
jgi:hypothetical protein